MSRRINRDQRSPSISTEAFSGHPERRFGLGFWAGRVISALAVLFLLFDAVIKLMKAPPVLEAFRRLGYPENLAQGIGILLLACIVFYVIPRTSVLGAILLTGYLGGAVATHVRVRDPLFSHVLFPVYMGVLI